MIPTPNIRTLAHHEWSIYKDLRLRALADSPDAFGSFVECLGLTAIYTATQFWDYNDAKAIEKENRLVEHGRKGAQVS